LTLLQCSEVKIERDEDKSLKIIKEGPDLDTLAFSSGQDAEVRNIKTSILSEEWPELFSDSSPNALLSYQPKNSNKNQQIIFSMDQPTHKKDNNTFEFTAIQSNDQRQIKGNTV
jgi:hypothetical protein